MYQLYKCTQDIQAVLDEHFDNEQEAADTLEAVIGQGEAVAVNVLGYCLNLEAEAKMIDARIKELADAKKLRQGKADRIKHELKAFMERHGIKSIKADDGTFSASIKKNPPSVEVFDEAQLPDEFWRVTEKREPNKTAIRQAI